MKNNKQPGRVTVPIIQKHKTQQKKITALTAYDFSFARLIDEAGVDIILIGDSLGMVVQGHHTTLPVTLDEMIYHCRCVVRGVQRALLVGDMPFGSYQASQQEALAAAVRFVKEGGVAAVKLEGGQRAAAAIEGIVNMDIPVMGHIGMTPQSFHRLGGHKVQGRGARKEAQQVLDDALAVEAAGVFAVVLECVPLELAEEITQRLAIPTIGIGAGPCCDGQILVMHDMLGLNEDAPFRFVRRYAELALATKEAVAHYVHDVSEGAFPSNTESFHAIGDSVSIPRYNLSDG